jgi:hypothetical protein
MLAIWRKYELELKEQGKLQVQLIKRCISKLTKKKREKIHIPETQSLHRTLVEAGSRGLI